MKKLLTICSVFTLLILLNLNVFAGPIKAGLAKANITPAKPIWMAGYAARTQPSQGKLHNIYAKALAIADDKDGKFVLVTADILGFSRELVDAIADAAEKKYGLTRDQLMLNASHTHTGPVIRQNAVGIYQLDADQATNVYEYSQFLQERILWVIGQALRDMTQVKLSLGHGTGTFAVNRREKTAEGIRIGVNPSGVVDQDVPVLRIEAKDDKLLGVVFGYACHNTTLTDKILAISGDYAGFAQQELEKNNPGVQAMFVQGCGADVNPNPRGTVELGEQHGKTLAKIVESVIAGKMSSLKGNIKTAFERVNIPFATPPTREQFQQRLTDKSVYVKRHADRMLARLMRDGKLTSEYAYPVQVFQLGNDFTLVGLGGEVVTDYVLRLKKELGTNGLWVAGYSNEVMAYIPSERMFSEGGYEVVESMIYYDMPASWAPTLEDIIIGKAKDLAESVGRRK